VRRDGWGWEEGEKHARASARRRERKIERIAKKETQIMREGVEKKRRSTTSVCEKKREKERLKR